MMLQMTYLHIQMNDFLPRSSGAVLIALLQYLARQGKRLQDMPKEWLYILRLSSVVSVLRHEIHRVVSIAVVEIEANDPSVVQHLCTPYPR
jgi:hypothetical protein